MAWEKHLYSTTIWLLTANLLGVGLAACKAETPEEKQARICRETPVPSQLNTTISSDGKMIAVLSYVDNCGKKRLRYKNVDPEGPWQEMPIGTGVDSIRFGLKGHELMVTRRVREGAGTWLGKVNQVDSWGELYKVNLDHPDQKPQTLYEAYGVIHPVEVTPGVIMVQNCVTTPDKRCHSTLGWQWDLVKDGKRIHRWPYGGPDGNRGNLNFGWPNVVPGQGAFWFKVRGYYKEGEPYPDFWSVAFPGKRAPKFSQPLEEDTEDLECNYELERCIRDFSLRRSGLGTSGFDREILWKGRRCALEGVRGDSYEKSLTPDGLASVMSLFNMGDKYEHVVFLKFSLQQCEPTSVQHIYLEEK